MRIIKRFVLIIMWIIWFAIGCTIVIPLVLYIIFGYNWLDEGTDLMDNLSYSI